MGGVEDDVLERRSISPYLPLDAIMLDVIFKELGFGLLIESTVGLAYHPLYFNKFGSIIPRLRYGLIKALLTGSKFTYWFGLRAFIKHTMATIHNKANPFNSFVSSVVISRLAAHHCGPITAASLLLGSYFVLFDVACDHYNYHKADSRSD